MAQLGRTSTGDFLQTAQTFWNANPGVNKFLVDPNCHCFNPQTTQVLNPAAWTDAAGGTFGASAPFYNNYRWQRQPVESMSLGRNFRMGKEGRYNLNLRGEFQNVFNRLFLSAPAVGGGFATINLQRTGLTSYSYVSATYDFIPTPEPSAMSLVGLGLAAHLPK